MSKVLTHIIKRIPVSDWSPDRIADQWVDGFKTNAERINAKRKLKIANESDYQNRVVGATEKGFKDVLNPNIISKSGLNRDEILNKLASNLGKSYKKYNQKLDAVYETVDGIPAKRFKESVEISKEHFKRKISKVLAMTGTHAEGLGPAPFAGYWLTADNRAEGMLLPADELIAGSPILICRIELRGSLKSALNQRLNQAGFEIMDSEYDQNIIDKQNEITNQLVNGLTDPALNLEDFLTTGKSFINYRYSQTDGFYLEVKISQK